MAQYDDNTGSTKQNICCIAWLFICNSVNTSTFSYQWQCKHKGCISFVCSGCAEHVLANEVVRNTLCEQTEQSAGCTTFWGGAEGIKMAEPIIFICNRCGICFVIRATYENHQCTGIDKPSRLIYELVDYIFVNFNYRDKFAVSVSCKDIISDGLPLDFGNQ